MRPYVDVKTAEYIHREFLEDTPEEELVWHRDYSNRRVFVEEVTDWMFQFENELPFLMEGNFTINKGTYHRLIKGKGTLTIKILEY